MQKLVDANEHITLTEAAKIAPGRPTPNCLWRWCRKGVLARNGERIFLRHMRVGGKIFTSRSWLNDFGNALAAADARYFDTQVQQPIQSPPTGTNSQRLPAHRLRAVEKAENELDREGC